MHIEQDKSAPDFTTVSVTGCRKAARTVDGGKIMLCQCGVILIFQWKDLLHNLQFCLHLIIVVLLTRMLLILL